MPAPLGSTSDTRGHVATEHDACVWEACLSLEFPLRVLTGALDHRLKCQRSLTPTVYKNMPKFIIFIHRSEGPCKTGLARTCAYTINTINSDYISTEPFVQPANSGPWHSTLHSLLKCKLYICNPFPNLSCKALIHARPSILTYISNRLAYAPTHTLAPPVRHRHKEDSRVDINIYNNIPKQPNCNCLMKQISDPTAFAGKTNKEKQRKAKIYSKAFILYTHHTNYILVTLTCTTFAGKNLKSKYISNYFSLLLLTRARTPRIIFIQSTV